MMEHTRPPGSETTDSTHIPTILTLNDSHEGEQVVKDTTNLGTVGISTNPRSLWFKVDGQARKILHAHLYCCETMQLIILYETGVQPLHIQWLDL